ncbi:MAG: dockerin type I repeat-containing protein [Clostridia bacterium]|nr:dockerin type I repeat-containing protein [Clostridia bacterium]
MKIIFRKALCCILSIVLLLGSTITGFAVEDNETPVIVVNDINYNPIYNTDNNSVVFNYSDYQLDILFTSGFSENILELFSADVLMNMKDMPTLDIIMLLIDYLGFGGDINEIINKAIETIVPLLGSLDMESFDIKAIIESIDFNQIIEDFKLQIQARIDNIKLLKMNEDGTPAYPSIGALELTESLEYYFNEDYDFAYSFAGVLGESIAESIGYENTYIFTYDWRLDPVKNAERMAEFVEHVKDETGSDKVSILSEGYGSTVATTYLAIEEDAAENVKNFVTVSSEFLGTSVVGDFMKGEIINKKSDLLSFSSAYIRYTNDISDNPLTAFSTWLINYVLNNEWELQSFCFEIEKILSDLEFFAEHFGITAEIAKMPGIWALVPTEDYETALANIYGEDTEFAIYETINTFKDYQYDYESILTDAKDNGINISVVAAWDLQIVPLGENNSVQSDGVVDTSYASFGATCVDLNDVKDAGEAVQEYNDGHDHISDTYDMLTPWYSMGTICHYVDASTCALPENTWFIKNMKHGTFSYESNSIDFLIWLITAENERTVWQDVAYKQFMNYNRFINPGILSSDGIRADEAIPGKYLLGDINIDTLVTSLDASVALRVEDGDEYIEEGTIPFMNGDVYPDKLINGADARKILLMSAGLIDYMQSGIRFDYKTEKEALDDASYNVELRPSYNSGVNCLELQLILLDAEGATGGNFIINYDEKLFTYTDADTTSLSEGFAVSGKPIKTTGVLSCAFAVKNGVDAADCDENGDLLLATYHLDVKRAKPVDSTFKVGAAYFYESNDETFITPVTLDIPADFYFMLGDTDNNRYISASDARKVLRIAARLDTVTDEVMFKRCDVDFDGKITAKDARLILRVAAHLQPGFGESTDNNHIDNEIT